MKGPKRQNKIDKIIKMQHIKRRTKIRQRIVVSLLVLIITIYICAGFLMYSWVGILYINLIKDAPLFYPWSTPGW